MLKYLCSRKWTPCGGVTYPDALERMGGWCEPCGRTVKVAALYFAKNGYSY